MRDTGFHVEVILTSQKEMRVRAKEMNTTLMYKAA